jgi:hypothetical protein
MRKSYTAIHRDAATAVEEQSGGDIRIQDIDDSPANSGLLSETTSRDMPTVDLDQQLQDSGSDNARGIPPRYISPASSTGSDDVHKVSTRQVDGSSEIIFTYIVARLCRQP